MLEKSSVFAVTNGAPNRYHVTLTRFWVRLVGHMMENPTYAESTDELLVRLPFLLDRVCLIATGEERLSNRTRHEAAGLNPTWLHYPE
ncbi:MAG TPA: hypothetical protein VNA15_01205 [Candidatus Angelobacter sp.]|nr:hypothetical protein [Candidatus Angelobacter sp.]